MHPDPWHPGRPTTPAADRPVADDIVPDDTGTSGPSRAVAVGHRVTGAARRAPRRTLATLLAACLAVPGLALLSPPEATAAATASCGAFGTTVLERVNPTTQTNSLTLSRGQSAGTEALGFTSVRDASVRAAASRGTGLVAVHRLYRSSRGGDFFYSAATAEIHRLVTTLGYVDQGTVFYAGQAPSSCLVPVWSYHQGMTHRYVTSAADQAALVAAGWKKQKIRFYLRPVTVDPTFTIAVMPDTQQEVLSSGDGRMINRAHYLVQQRRALDLRFVSHTGDVVNWDTGDHVQYKRAAAGLQPLYDAGIPVSLTIGNHDTKATCPGGSACNAARTRQLFRTTTTFNRYLDPGPLDQEGAFEAGKVDNTYHVFTAGGASWLVLNLELWPRKSVVRWAQQVVATHPRHNVMVLTHSYLTSSGKIYTGRGGYGDTSGTYLYDNLISRYANIRLVFSGHTGQAKHRVDTGVHGNRVDSYLLAVHSGTTNPMRFVMFNTKTRSMRTWVYAPWTKHTYQGKGFAGRVTGLTWLR